MKSSERFATYMGSSPGIVYGFGAPIGATVTVTHVEKWSEDMLAAFGSPLVGTVEWLRRNSHWLMEERMRAYG